MFNNFNSKFSLTPASLFVLFFLCGSGGIRTDELLIFDEGTIT